MPENTKHSSFFFGAITEGGNKNPLPRPRQPSGRAGGGTTTLFVVDMWISCGKLVPVEVLRGNHNSMGYFRTVQFFLFGDFLLGGGFFRRFFPDVKIPVFAQNVAKNAHFLPEISYFWGIRSAFWVFCSVKS